MKIVALVPIKLNSERFPNKNIKEFRNGKPLCWYIFHTLLKIKELSGVYVYCSNESIKNYIPSEVEFLKRSEKLDSNTTKINEILMEFANEIDADVYLLSHATAPFISCQSIVKGIDAVLTQGYDSSFAAKKLQDFLWKDGRPFNYQLESIPRTQDLEVLYYETSGFYIYKRDVILNLNRRIGEHPYIVEVGEIEGIDIDEKEDFEMADAIFNFTMEEKT